MKQAICNLLGVTGLLLAIPVIADTSATNISQQQIEECRANRSVPNYAKIRTLIDDRQYAAALAGMDVPNESTPDELRYLYGKTLYLQSMRKVEQRRTDKPDSALLASATKHIEAAAKAGYAEAIFAQAIWLTPPQDQNARLALLRQAANKHYVPAMLTLARELFITSQTFEQRVDAQSLVQKAAVLDTAAKIELARYYLHEDQQLNNTTGYDRDIDKAISLLVEATRDCEARAAYLLYELAHHKHKPNSLDTESAISWLTVSSQLGYAKAQGELAEHYYKIEPNTDRALKWGKQAADAGDITGLIVLGNIYYTGTGVGRDHGTALKFFEKALQLDNDNRYVQDQLGMMYYKGEGVEANFRRAADLCKLAANKGQPGCQYYLGLMYVNGEGVTQDIDRGIDWMKKSAAQDFITAKNWLRENW